MAPPSEDQVQQALRDLGYVQMTNGANGGATIWKPPPTKDDPNPASITQVEAAANAFGSTSPYANAGASDNTAQVDGAGVPYIVKNGRGYDLNGNPYNPVPLPVNPHPGFTSSSSTSYNATPQRV